MVTTQGRDGAGRVMWAMGDIEINSKPGSDWKLDPLLNVKYIVLLIIIATSFVLSSFSHRLSCRVAPRAVVGRSFSFS